MGSLVHISRNTRRLPKIAEVSAAARQMSGAHLPHYRFRCYLGHCNSATRPLFGSLLVYGFCVPLPMYNTLLIYGNVYDRNIKTIIDKLRIKKYKCYLIYLLS